MFNKYLVIMTLIIISGCNSDNSNVDSEPEIRDLPPVSSEVFPPVSSKMGSIHLFGPDSVVQNQTIKIKVFARYSNQTQKDVSSEVNWYVSDQKIATINANGELLGLVPGTVDITAEIKGLVTKQFSVMVKTHLVICGSLNDSDRTNANGGCLKVVQGKSGESEHKLFTSSPSVNVMALLGYEINDTEDNRGKTYAKKVKSNCKDPVGEFVLFRQDGGEDWDDDYLSPDFGENGQYDRFCQELSLIKFYDKNDWRRASRDEIVSLVESGNLFTTYGWPAQYHYWTSTSKDDKFYAVGGLTAKIQYPRIVSTAAYVSCVSETL